MKEIHIFNKEGSAGIDVKVPSASYPCDIDLGKCVHRRSPKHGRQIAGGNTVILTENQCSETSEGSGQSVAQSVTLTAMGNLEHEQPPIEQRSWSIGSQVYPKKDSLVDTACRKT